MATLDNGRWRKVGDGANKTMGKNSAIPSAGIIRIRFYGFYLRLSATPAKMHLLEWSIEK
jgi:hypothetical protein